MADGEFDEYPDCNEAEGLPMSNGGESAYFPTAMFASRVYLSVVKKRQTKGIAPRRSEGFEIHAALVDGRVGKPKPTENSAKRANAGPTADLTAPHVIHIGPTPPVCADYLIPQSTSRAMTAFL